MRALIVAPHYSTFIAGLAGALLRELGVTDYRVFIPEWRSYRLFGKDLSIFKNLDYPSCDIPSDRVIRVGIDSVAVLLKRDIVKNIHYLFTESFDIVLSFFIIPYGLLGTAIASRLGIPHFTFGLGFDVYDVPYRNFYLRKIVKDVVSQATGIVTVSPMLTNILTKITTQRLDILTISMGYDPRMFFPYDKASARRELGLNSSSVILLNVGNLVPIKNHLLLLKAFKGLCARSGFTDIQLFILGEGVMRNRLESYIRDSGLKNKTFLPGRIAHKDISKWMNASDFFVLPSINEGSPTVVSEALGCGLPVVATAVGNVPNLVSDGSDGLLIQNPKSVENIQKVLYKAMFQRWDRSSIYSRSGRLTWAQQAFLVGRYIRARI